MKNLIGKLQIMLLLKSPPALFSCLFGLPWYRNMLEQWASPLNKPNARVLDIGCAGGDFSRVLAAQSMAVWAVDRSFKMIAQAQKTPGIVQFKQADAMELSFPDQHFDIVLAASLLNVVDAPLVALTEMCRVCRVGGTVSVLVPNLKFTDADAKRYLDAEKLIGFSRAAFSTWHRLAKKIDVDVLQGCFKDCGMINITTRQLLGDMVVTISGQVVNKD